MEEDARIYDGHEGDGIGVKTTKTRSGRGDVERRCLKGRGIETSLESG